MTYADYLLPILTSMQNQLLGTGVFLAAQVGISFTELPSSQPVVDFACNLMPAEGEALQGQVFGAGRYASGYRDLVAVNIYGRNAMDRIYLDTSLLTDATLGLLGKAQSTFDALHLFLPVDGSGNALTEEPIRCVSITQPVKYPTSPDWSFISLIYEVVSAFNIDPLGP